jgi:AcrR family transcriptional regulator
MARSTRDDEWVNTSAARTSTRRTTLTRERVLQAGLDLADDAGLEAVSMRRLGQELGVEAMSLYNHVANKDDLLDGMVEMVMVEVNRSAREVRDGAEPGADWQGVLRAQVLASRQHMLRHRWLPVALESRAGMSPGVARYFDGVLATLLAGGFSNDLGHHALHALGSRALGFTQELFTPGNEEQDAASQAAMASMARELPHLVAMLAEVAHYDPESTLGWCDDQSEFEFGLDVLLDGLERRRPPQPSPKETTG